jgi:phospholipase A-2-activating protein
LIQTLAATNRYHATKISREEMLVVRDMLKWPPAEAFPALDLARLMVLHPDAASRDKNEYWNEGKFLGVER